MSMWICIRPAYESMPNTVQQRTASVTYSANQHLEPGGNSWRLEFCGWFDAPLHRFMLFTCRRSLPAMESTTPETYLWAH
jgi:hypothetical protein